MRKKYGFPEFNPYKEPEQKVKITYIYILLIIYIIVFLLLFLNFAFADTASWYSTESCQKEGTSGIWTASGAKFDENTLTCALRSRDFGGYYKVTNLDTGKSIIVKHTDFGPNKKLWLKGRKIDLSKQAFYVLSNGHLEKGILKVKIERIVKNDWLKINQ